MVQKHVRPHLCQSSGCRWMGDKGKRKVCEDDPGLEIERGERQGHSQGVPAPPKHHQVCKREAGIEVLLQTKESTVLSIKSRNYWNFLNSCISERIQDITFDSNEAQKYTAPKSLELIKTVRTKGMMPTCLYSDSPASQTLITLYLSLLHNHCFERCSHQRDETSIFSNITKHHKGKFKCS